MKTLLILRHAKAEDHSAEGDKGRALTGRGERDAASIGKQIKAQFGYPDLIVTSEAKRAQQTAGIVAQEVGYTSEITTRSTLYNASLHRLLDTVQALPDGADRVLLVGHNPGLEQLAGDLDAEALAPQPLATAGLVRLQFDTARWKDVRPHTGQGRKNFTPEHHEDKGN